MDFGDWPSRPDGTGVLPEYRDALASCAVMPALMRVSPGARTLAYLSGARTHTHTHTDAGGEDAVSLLTRVVQKAYSLSSESKARTLTGALPGICDTPCVWHESAREYLISLSWENKFLLAALRALLESEDADGLKVVLALMARSARECMARKRATFSTIISRVRVPAETVARSSAGADTGELAGVTDAELIAARDRLVAACAAFIADMKDRAFQSTFMEPTHMWACLTGAEAVAIDADVHGAPTYLALLDATVGVRTSRMGELNDEAKGIADAVAAGMDDALKMLWADEHLGRSWNSIHACKTAVVRRHVDENTFIFPNRATHWSFCSVRDFAEKAVIDTPGNADNRRRMAVYLKQFFSYFSAEPLLRRLFTVTTSGTVASSGSEDGLLHELQRVFDHLKSKDTAGIHPGNEVEASAVIPADWDDVRQYVWDIEAIPPTFNVAAARRLFAAVGVVKSHTWRLMPASGGAAAAGAAGAVARPPGVDGAAPAVLDIPASVITLSAAGDICGGGTGKEFVANLVKDGCQPWNKWVHPGYVTRSWVVAQLSAPYVVTSYGLCSANDGPHRDPTSWALLGQRADGGDWITLHEFPRESGAHPRGFEERWQWLWFDIREAARGPFSTIRLEIRKVRDPGDCLQLAHWKLKGFPASIDESPRAADADIVPIPAECIRLTAAGDVCGGGTGRERLENLLNDGTEPWNKWLHPGNVRASWVQADFVQPAASGFRKLMPRLRGSANAWVVTGYAVCSANDCPHRDPISWVLVGCLQGSNSWVPLHRFPEDEGGPHSAPGFSSRWEWLSFRVPVPQTVTAVRLNITRVRSPGDCIQLGHWRIHGHLPPA